MSKQAQNSVLERRLRPIYDWLDQGNNKKAAQEAERLLKKQPDLQCPKVLLALANLRLGHQDKAETLLAQVHQTSPTDDAVLQAMSIAYRELQNSFDVNTSNLIITMYEKACAAEPNNEELLSHLFMSYVRQGDYKKQKTTAMALFKAVPKNPYYFWAVMSTVLQALDSDETTCNKLLLPLAERMISKMEADGKMEQEQETHLYIMVLELQQKYKEALDLLDGPLGKKLTEQTSFANFIETKRLEFLKKLEMWPQVNILAKQMLIKNPDQWNVYLDYVHSVFLMVDQGKDTSDEVDATPDEALKFIQKQQNENQKCRGPYLAELELESRLMARNNATNKGKFLDLLVSYFGKFGAKTVCFSDLTLYLPQLAVSEHDAFFRQASESITFSEENTNVPSSVPDLHRHVILYQLKRYVGRHHNMTKEAMEDLVAEFRHAHVLSQDLVEDFKPTEQRPNDMYIILATQTLWQLWMETSEDKYFWKAIVLLELVLRKSPHNYHARFLLLRFYNQIGAVVTSQFTYSFLELKHIQLDTLGHLVCNHALTAGDFAGATRIYGTTLKFFTTNYKDIVEHIIQAFRCGTFDKIREFISLRERLSTSQHYTLLTAEKMLLDLLAEPDSHAQTVQMMSYFELDPDKDDVQWRDIQDNRDFKAMISYDPPEKAVTDELISESFMANQRHLRLRTLIMRCLAASVYLSEDIHPARQQDNNSAGDPSDGQNGNSKADKLVKVLETLVGQFEDTSALCSKESMFDFRTNPMQGPYRPRCQLFINDEHDKLFVALVRLVLVVQEQSQRKDENKICEATKLVVNCYNSIVSCLVSRLKDPQEHLLINREELFEAIYNAVESSSFSCVLLGVSYTLLQPSKPSQASKKSKKKNKEQVTEQSKPVEAFNAMVQSIKDTLCHLKNEIASFRNACQIDATTIEAESKFANLTLNADLSHKIFESESVEKAIMASSIERSYKNCEKQISDVIDKKIIYLSYLKL